MNDGEVVGGFRHPQAVEVGVQAPELVLPRQPRRPDGRRALLAADGALQRRQRLRILLLASGSRKMFLGLLVDAYTGCLRVRVALTGLHWPLTHRLSAAYRQHSTLTHGPRGLRLR